MCDVKVPSMKIESSVIAVAGFRQWRCQVLWDTAPRPDSVSGGAGFKDWLDTPRVWLNVSKPAGYSGQTSRIMGMELITTSISRGKPMRQ